MKEIGCGPRAIALVGPEGAGKTSLAEALLLAAGAAKPGVRNGSSGPDIVHFDWMGDPYLLIDLPGAADLDGEAATALVVADLALVLVDPDPARAPLVGPMLRRLEALGVPHALFVNKIDQARGNIDELLASLQPMSGATLVARQIPILAGERVAGFVDLALERAYHYQPGKRSQQVPLAAHLKDGEHAARAHMLEQLADHDDILLEQLLSDQVPSLDTVFGDLHREMAGGQIVPVLFGSAQNAFGVRRLLKMLRHDTPPASATAKRLGIEGAAIQVLKTGHDSKFGKLTLARLFGGPLAEGRALKGAGSAATPAGGLFRLQGGTATKAGSAEAGDIIAIAKAETAQVGEVFAIGG